MAYIINRTDGTQLSVIEDGTIDQTTTLKLVGKNYAGYGEIQNENFLHLLENFSSANQPARPLSGQVWFDSSVKKLKFYDGTKFRTTGGAEVSNAQPVGLTEGDFWWDSANSQLYAQTNAGGFVLIGPSSIGDSVSSMVTALVRDTVGQNRTIIRGTVNDEVVFIISSEQFTIDGSDPDNAITGFDVVRQGLTLKNTTDGTGGVTSSAHRFWGTASNALKLGGVDASNFVQTVAGQDTTFNTIARFTDAGFTVGDNNDLLVEIESGNEGNIENTVGNKIKFKVKDGSVTKEPLNVLPTGLVPSVTTTFDLGTSALRYDNVYATSFVGEATYAVNLKVGSNYRSASVAATNDTVAVRDSQGNLTATVFNGVASSARFADLAEKYTTDKEYNVGTVMMISTNSESEATACSNAGTPIGVISTEPAYLMNSDSEGQAIGLVGRVPVLVLGAVSKGQTLYATDNGYATAEPVGAKIGIAIESKEDSNEGLVETFLKF